MALEKRKLMNIYGNKCYKVSTLLKQTICANITLQHFGYPQRREKSVLTSSLQRRAGGGWRADFITIEFNSKFVFYKEVHMKGLNLWILKRS